MRISLGAIVFVSLPACAFAQLATTTSLVGNVTDSAGAAIAGASITAVNTGTTDTYTAVTILASDAVV